MLHQYKLNGYNIVLDTCSGSVHSVDEVAYDIIAMYETATADEIVSAMMEKYGDREDVTEEELRQLCVDAFRINLSFTWTPTKELSYEFTLLERTTGVDIPKGIAYAGMFYNNNNARGNIWKVLQYFFFYIGVANTPSVKN